MTLLRAEMLTRYGRSNLEEVFLDVVRGRDPDAREPS